MVEIIILLPHAAVLVAPTSGVDEIATHDWPPEVRLQSNDPTGGLVGQEPLGK
jgi:hypothetical protein